MPEINENPVENTTEKENNAMSYDEGVIKVNLGELNKPAETEPAEIAETTEPVVEPEAAQPEEVQTVEEASKPESIIEEIIDEAPEVIQEATGQLTEDVAEAIEAQKEKGIDLPENIQKVVDFINETGGTLEDYVTLNRDYSSFSEDALLREYYEKTKPHLDKEDIDLLMEDFSYDEELDEEKDIRKARLAKKEELARAKSHLESLKTKYYDEIKRGSRLTPDQQEAVNFFNRYKKENKEAATVAERQSSAFKNKTEKLFSDEFKGFDFNVGEKKFRFKVNNVEQVKNQQVDINNFVKKFLNDNNEVADVSGYHKSLFTAMNPDAIANHFYEQGKADAIKNTMAKAKNIDMEPRSSHEEVKASNGWTVKSITPSTSSSKLRIKTKR